MRSVFLEEKCRQSGDQPNRSDLQKKFSKFKKFSNLEFSWSNIFRRYCIEWRRQFVAAIFRYRDIRSESYPEDKLGPADQTWTGFLNQACSFAKTQKTHKNLIKHGSVYLFSFESRGRLQSQKGKVSTSFEPSRLSRTGFGYKTAQVNLLNFV